MFVEDMFSRYTLSKANLSQFLSVLPPDKRRKAFILTTFLKPAIDGVEPKDCYQDNVIYLSHDFYFSEAPLCWTHPTEQEKRELLLDLFLIPLYRAFGVSDLTRENLLKKL